MFLLDTCVISELMRQEPNPLVSRWIRRVDPLSLFLSVLTLGELHYGAALEKSLAKEREIAAWIADIERRFAHRIVVVDDGVARHWGYLRAGTPNAPIVDTQLAATAIAHGLTFVTRNVKHFGFDGLAVVNPWVA
jgi:predicted nucleic acid-binding protein